MIKRADALIPTAETMAVKTKTAKEELAESEIIVLVNAIDSRAAEGMSSLTVKRISAPVAAAFRERGYLVREVTLFTTSNLDVNFGYEISW